MKFCSCYRHTDPFIYHHHHHHHSWRIFISAHENAIKGNQKGTNPKCENAFFSGYGDLDTKNLPLTSHPSCCKLCQIWGAGMRFSPMSRRRVTPETKNPLVFLETKGKAHDGTQMQKSFGYIFDAQLLWIADSHFWIHIRATIYFIFSQA